MRVRVHVRASDTMSGKRTFADADAGVGGDPAAHAKRAGGGPGPAASASASASGSADIDWASEAAFFGDADEWDVSDDSEGVPTRQHAVTATRARGQTAAHPHPTTASTATSSSASVCAPSTDHGTRGAIHATPCVDARGTIDASGPRTGAGARPSTGTDGGAGVGAGVATDAARLRKDVLARNGEISILREKLASKAASEMTLRQLLYQKDQVGGGGCVCGCVSV